MKQVYDAIARAGSVIRSPIPMLMSEWADNNFYLSAESSGIEGRWQCYPYQVAILNWMGSDDIRTLTWRKSARTGYTKCLLICFGYNATHRKRSQLIYQPTDSDAKDFVRDEIDPTLRDVAIVREQLRCDPETKSPYNTHEKKAFKGCILDIKGGKSGRNYRRMTKDLVMYDELDGFAKDIDGEGSPTSLGDKRTDASPFPKSLRGSTPREKETSQIEQSLREADMVFERYLPCPHCGVMQKLQWKNIVFEKNEPETAKYACDANGCVIDYSEYPDMDAGGQWQTANGDYYDEEQDLFFDSAGEIISPPRHIGVILWGAYSYNKTWSDGVYDFLTARKEQKKGDLTKLKSWTNLYLGESYEEKGERIEQKWEDRLEDYDTRNAIPNGIVFINAGVDVQGGKNARIEGEIVGWGIGEESWSLDYFTIKGQPEQQHVWDHLEEKLTQIFTREDGVVLRIGGACIDSGYLADEVFKFTAPRRRRNIYASKGKAQSVGPIAGVPGWQGSKGKIRALQIPINTGDAKEIIYTRLEDIDKPGPGYCHFPAHYDDTYFMGLTAEEKRTKYVKGVQRKEWVVISKRRNEPLDCRVYATASLRHCNPRLPILAARLKKQPAVPEKKTQTNSNTISSRKKSRPSRRRGGFVNGWK